LSVSRSGRPTVPEEEVGAARDQRGPGRIVLRPAIPEWEESGGDYEELIDALAEQGVDVELAEIKGIPSGSDLPEFVPLAFAIFIGIRVTDALIDTIVDEVLRVVVARAKTRWWRKDETVKGVIYGPSGGGTTRGRLGIERRWAAAFE
jgi:hypothetical protein